MVSTSIIRRHWAHRHESQWLYRLQIHADKLITSQQPALVNSLFILLLCPGMAKNRVTFHSGEVRVHYGTPELVRYFAGIESLQALDITMLVTFSLFSDPGCRYVIESGKNTQCSP